MVVLTLQNRWPATNDADRKQKCVEKAEGQNAEHPAHERAQQVALGNGSFPHQMILSIGNELVESVSDIALYLLAFVLTQQMSISIYPQFGYFPIYFQTE